MPGFVKPEEILFGFNDGIVDMDDPFLSVI
jgi:hypothetical protein